MGHYCPLVDKGLMWNIFKEFLGSCFFRHPSVFKIVVSKNLDSPDDQKLLLLYVVIILHFWC